MVRRSFLKELGDLTLWIYLEAEPLELVSSSTITASAALDNSMESGSVTATNHNLLYGLIAVVLVLGGILFFRSKRS